VFLNKFGINFACRNNLPSSKLDTFIANEGNFCSPNSPLKDGWTLLSAIAQVDADGVFFLEMPERQRGFTQQSGRLHDIVAQLAKLFGRLITCSENHVISCKNRLMP
jgi:hypothetical protein